MTAKEFFKSTSFKCIVTLLCILLVCGIFLTVAYGFLEVTDEERLQRAINKIYGAEVKVTVLDDYTEEDTVYPTANIIEAYRDENGNYLIKSKGKGGYNGTVTCWVLVEVEDNAVSKVSKVVIETSDGETLLSSINFLDKYATVEYTDGYEYTTENGFKASGATLSSGAINNSVNSAVSFVRQVYLGYEDPYAAYQYHDYIDMENTTWDMGDGNVLTYNITTKSNSPAKSFKMTIVVGEDKTITQYTITEWGSVANIFDDTQTEEYFNDKINVSLYIGKDKSYFESIVTAEGDNSNFAENGIATGATKSNYLCLYAGLFATANYDVITSPDGEEGGNVNE